MGEVSDFRLERARREADNTRVGVAELLGLASAAIAAGELDGAPVRAIIIIETKKPDGSYGVEAFRCGCTRYEEVALLRLQETTVLEDWRRP